MDKYQRNKGAQAIGERATREREKRRAKMEKENELLRSSVEGYRRDIDNCLAELKHKNQVLRDRDVEYGRVCLERDQAMAAARLAAAQCAPAQESTPDIRATPIREPDRTGAARGQVPA